MEQEGEEHGEDEMEEAPESQASASANQQDTSRIEEDDHSKE